MAPEDKQAMDRVAARIWGMLPEQVRKHELQLMSEADAGAMLELLAGR